MRIMYFAMSSVPSCGARPGPPISTTSSSKGGSTSPETISAVAGAVRVRPSAAGCRGRQHRRPEGGHDGPRWDRPGRAEQERFPGSQVCTVADELVGEHERPRPVAGTDPLTAAL